MARVTPRDIWDALERAGASSVQAAGIMGNMIAESGLNPEAINPAGPQSGVGLVQWQTTDFPGVPRPTGNPLHDMQQQINFLASTGGFKAASGTTVAETAGSFAANYERCAGCESGGGQNKTRIANAATVAGWASGGNWPSSTGGASDTATLTAAQAAQQATGNADCAWAIGWGGIPDTSWLHWLGVGGSGNVGSGQICLLSKPAARMLIGVALLAAGILLINQGIFQMERAAGVFAAVLHPVKYIEGEKGPGSGTSVLATKAKARAAGGGAAAGGAGASVAGEGEAAAGEAAAAGTAAEGATAAELAPLALV